MNTQIYDDLVRNYKKRQRKKQLIAFAVMVLGFLLTFTGIGGIVGLVALLYLYLMWIDIAVLALARKKSKKELQANGLYDAAMQTLQHAERLQLDGLTYAWTNDFFFTGYGAIFPMQKIAWIFPFTYTARKMMIPIARQHWCQIMMLDGTSRVAFYGRVKDQAAFKKMLHGMHSVNPELQIGHTPANEELYNQRVTLYKTAQGL